MNKFIFVWLTLICVGPRALANVVGPDPENFNPTTNGLDFVTVESAETLEPGILNFGLFSDYAVNTLPHFDNTVSTNRVNLNDFLLLTHLNAGLGLAKNWDVGVSLPFLVTETVRDSNYSGVFYSTGLMDVEVNSKYRITGNGEAGLAAVGSVNFNTMNDNPYTGSGAKPVYTVEAAYDHTIGHWAAALNAGYRIRQPGSQLSGVPVEPLKNQYIGSLAASYHFPEYDTKLIFELFGSYPASSAVSNSDRSISSLEALLGVKHDFTAHVAFHAGAGTQIFTGTSTPAWRIYAGLNVALDAWSRPAAVQPAPVPAVTEVTASAVKVENTSDFVVPGDLLFHFGSIEMTGEGSGAMDQFAENLNKGFKKLTIKGHTDSVGPELFNQYLSEQRALAVKKILVEKHHVDGSKIETKGFGSKQPIANNGNFQGRRKNRRVEFELEK